MHPAIGILAALASCTCWAWSSVRFAPLVAEHGPFAVNLFKAGFALLVLAVALPLELDLDTAWPIEAEELTTLLLSGFVGMALGDWAYLQAMRRTGVREATLLHGTNPVFLLLYGLLGFGHALVGAEIAGVLLVVAGTSLVVTARAPAGPGGRAARGVGLAFGLLAALGQAGGIVLSKPALPPEGGVPVLLGTAIRLVGAVCGLLVIAALRGRLQGALGHLRDPVLWRRASFPAFVGTFLGVRLMMLAISESKSAVAGALLSLTPLFVLPIAWHRLGERFGPRVVFASAVAVGGVVLLSLGG